MHQQLSLRLAKRCLDLLGCRSAATATLSKDVDLEWEAAKPFTALPSHRMLPFIGTAWTIMPLIGYYKISDQISAMKERRKRFGDVYREKFGSFNMVISFRVEDVETISRNEGKYPSRGEMQTLKVYRESRKELFKSLGIMLTNGPEWLNLRQKIQKHMLKPKAAETYLGSMQEVAVDFVQRMHRIRDTNNEVPNFNTELYKWSLESIAFVGLDSRLGCLESNLTNDSDGMKLITSVNTQFDCIYKMESFSGNIQIWKYISTPSWRRFVKACDSFNEIAFKYINKAANDLKVNAVAEDKDLTVLQALLVKEEMDASDAVTFVADMLMAGIETTSSTIGFLLYNLAKNPDKQEKLYEEVKRLFPTENTKMTPEIYHELKYLRSCLKESMRVKPTVGGMLRQLAKDSVIGGYQVPAGTNAVVSFLDIFQDEKCFRDPLKFIPERWLSRDDNFNPYSFLPFGFGTRSCVGRRVAELEMICLTAEIIRNFRVEYHFEDIGMRTTLLLVPDKPLRYNFIQR